MEFYTAGKKPQRCWLLVGWPSIFPLPVSELLFGKVGEGNAHVSRHPSKSGTLVWGARTSCVTGPQATPQGHLAQPWWVPCHPAGRSPQIPPSPPEATSTGADGNTHTNEAFPTSCAFGKLMGLVWLCLGRDGKPVPAKQTFYYRLV